MTGTGIATALGDFGARGLRFLASNAAAEWKFYLMVAAGLALGLAYDVARRRNLRARYRSAGFRTDCLYLLVELSHVMHVVILVPLAASLTALLSTNAPWLRIEAMVALPPPAKLAVLFLTTDFCAYWLHRAQHTNRYLWQFHKVHHSQEQLSSLTTFRMPILDRIVTLAVLTIPATAMGAGAAMPAAVILLVQLHQLLLHSDVGWTLGPLRHVFVSPAMHEAHHSSDPAHADRNFGSGLSTWDRLFGSYAERGRGELRYGLGAEAIPESFLRQLVVPVVGVCSQLRRDLARLRTVGLAA